MPIIAKSPVDEATRRGWLERLFEALQDDEIPYIEHLGDSWGEVCASKEIASDQADRLIGNTRRVLGPDRSPDEFFSGTSACLSALYKAERYEDLIEIAAGERVFWPYKRWAVRALSAQGCKAEAIRLAESSRGPWSSDLEINRLGEQILLSSGMVEEAYQRYGLSANRARTYLATFRAIAKRYPDKDAKTILADLVETTPGEEGKWFAAAKSVELFAEALELARSSPCDPRTLTRAARDFVTNEPAFALGAGHLALLWLAAGHGYEMTPAEVWEDYNATMEVAEQRGEIESVKNQIRKMLRTGSSDNGFVSGILARALVAQ